MALVRTVIRRSPTATRCGTRFGPGIKGRCCRHLPLYSATAERLELFSGDGKNRASKAVAKDRKYLFPLGNPVRPEKCDAAGRFTNVGPDYERLVSGPHAVGGEGKSCGELERFLRSHLRHKRRNPLRKYGAEYSQYTLSPTFWKYVPSTQKRGNKPYPPGLIPEEKRWPQSESLRKALASDIDLFDRHNDFVIRSIGRSWNDLVKPPSSVSPCLRGGSCARGSGAASLGTPSNTCPYPGIPP